VTVHFSRRTAPDYVTEAVKKASKIHARLPPGGILIFLTGQNEISGVCKKLEAQFGRRALDDKKRRRVLHGISNIPEDDWIAGDSPVVMSTQGSYYFTHCIVLIDQVTADVEPEDRDLGVSEQDGLAFDVDDGLAEDDLEALDSDDERDIDEELGIDRNEIDCAYPADTILSDYLKPTPQCRCMSYRYTLFYRVTSRCGCSDLHHRELDLWLYQPT